MRLYALYTLYILVTAEPGQGVSAVYVWYIAKFWVRCKNDPVGSSQMPCRLGWLVPSGRDPEEAARRVSSTSGSPHFNVSDP